MNPEFYKQVAARHQQFAEGAITYSEFLNTLICLGFQANVFRFRADFFVDKE